MLLILFRTLYSSSAVVKLKYSELTLRSVLIVNDSLPVLTFIPKVVRSECVYCKSRIIHGHCTPSNAFPKNQDFYRAAI